MELGLNLIQIILKNVAIKRLRNKNKKYRRINGLGNKMVTSQKKGWLQGWVIVWEKVKE